MKVVGRGLECDREPEGIDESTVSVAIDAARAITNRSDDIVCRIGTISDELAGNGRPVVDE